MDPLDLTQSFIERCERSVPQPELADSFEGALAQMGFRYFACCSNVNPRSPPRRSQLLKISEHTVHKHIEAAKRRLGVAARVQAIIWAAQRREISLGDVVNAVQPPRHSRPRRLRTLRATQSSIGMSTSLIR